MHLLPFHVTALTPPVTLAPCTIARSSASECGKLNKAFSSPMNHSAFLRMFLVINSVAWATRCTPTSFRMALKA